MAKPKFDYTGNEFYKEIEALAIKGLTDSQIANSLSEKFNETLSFQTFSSMKNGKYSSWNEEQNNLFSVKIHEALTRGREKINSIIRGTYLKMAVGGKKTTTTSTTIRKIRDENGEETGKEVIQEVITETELAPNSQALSTWLFNHDPEWRKQVIDGKKLDVTTNGQSLKQDYSGLSTEELVERAGAVIKITENENKTAK